MCAEKAVVICLHLLNLSKALWPVGLTSGEKLDKNRTKIGLICRFLYAKRLLRSAKRYTFQWEVLNTAMPECCPRCVQSKLHA